MRRSSRSLAWALLATLGPACGGGGAPTTTTSGATTTTPPDRATTTEAPTTTTAAPRPAPEAARVRLTKLADASQPLDLAVREGDPDALYIVEKGGQVRIMRDGVLLSDLALDLSGSVSAGVEQGLLGLTFSPDGEHAYVNYTDRAGDTHIAEFPVRGDGTLDRDRQRDLLVVDQPFDNHNGGGIRFGPDGLLYIALGDGGSAGDPGGRAQRLDTLLGKLLRIDPAASSDGPYRIPSGNPFTAQEDARAEIFHYGLRNPWRFSFDRGSGDLWIGDVGQNEVEEVDYLPAGHRGGVNFGWDRLEGSRRFEGSPPAEHVLPIHEYALAGGNCAVTGGFVYRGSRIPELRGAYLFADFCVGRIQALVPSEGRAAGVTSLGLTAERLASFGEDHDGELYVLSLAGEVFRLDPA